MRGAPRARPRRVLGPCGAILAAALAATVPARAEWKPEERIATYAVSGRSGIALYESIGRNGPRVGASRAIAHTDFELTWSRDYQQRDGACVLASARPRLVITYTLPRAAQTLPDGLDAGWASFVAGIEAHERVHGDFIKEMVAGIEAATVGLTVPQDPQCRKIRELMKARLSELSQAQRAKSRAFDEREMSKGGNIHRLILSLVNGD